jgi:Txe/YoeB family toxin of Txe-Axe toxin-antitoxin module
MAVLAALDLDPALGKKLQGRLAGQRSARLGATHRIIYVVEEGGVVVFAVQPRRDAFR